MKGVLSVKNFEQYQHYKDRKPPWIKLYNDVLDDYAFEVMPDASKAHLMLIWLLASRTDNRIPNDAVLATATLYRLGPRIAPRLERALADADAQARDALGLLLHDFETPPRDWSDFATRRDLHRLSRLSDPAAQPNRQGFLRYVGAFEDFDPRR